MKCDYCYFEMVGIYPEAFNMEYYCPRCGHIENIKFCENGGIKGFERENLGTIFEKEDLDRTIHHWRPSNK